MKRRLAIPVALSVSLLAIAACAPSPALTPAAPSVTPRTFAIRLDRPRAPGDRGMISTSVRSRRTTILRDADRVLGRRVEEREIDLEAMMEVLRVDAVGTPVSVAYTVEHLIVETPAGRTEILPGGWVLAAHRGDRAAFRSAEPLPREAREALDDVLAPLPAESSDDEVFGTDRPRAVGEAWPVSTALAERELGRMALDLPPGSVEGASRLAGLVEVGGRVCLDVRGEMRIRDGRLIDVPGVHPESAELQSTYERLIPVDGRAPEVGSTLQVDVDVTARVALGPDREGTLTATSRREVRRRFLSLHDGGP